MNRGPSIGVCARTTLIALAPERTLPATLTHTSFRAILAVLKRSILFDIIHQRGDLKQAVASKQARNDEAAQDHFDSKILLAFHTDRRDDILQMETKRRRKRIGDSECY